VKKSFSMLTLLIAVLLIMGACPGPALETTPAETTPTATHIPELPTGMGAFQGNVIWGDKPVAHAEVVATTKLSTIPEIVGPEEDIPEYNQFTAQTDEEGNFFLPVEPNNYCLYYRLPWSDFTYEYIEGFSYFPKRHEVTSGETISVSLKALDWSIELISPGELDPFTNKVINDNPPTLVWKALDLSPSTERATYYQVVDDYQVVISKGDDDYHFQAVLEERVDSTSYTVQNILEEGRYKWEVRAYTQTGKELAGTTGAFYFLVP